MPELWSLFWAYLHCRRAGGNRLSTAKRLPWFFANETNREHLRSVWGEQCDIIYSDKLGEVAKQFDRIHSVRRAQQVGSLHQVITS